MLAIALRLAYEPRRCLYLQLPLSDLLLAGYSASSVERRLGNT